MEATTVKEAVDNGIALFEEHYPDWREKLVNGFDMRSISGNCILSLVTETTSYGHACEKVDFSIMGGVPYGFDCQPADPKTPWNFAELSEEWESRL